MGLPPSFSDELTKIAIAPRVGPKQRAVNQVEGHHRARKKNWSKFEKSLKSKMFQRAVVEHDLSDEKLKEYSKQYGSYLSTRKSVGSIPSRSSEGKSYKVKELPGGRLACGCKDWQYKHSHQGTDCAHVKEFKANQAKVIPFPTKKPDEMKKAASPETTVHNFKIVAVSHPEGSRGHVVSVHQETGRFAHHMMPPDGKKPAAYASLRFSDGTIDAKIAWVDGMFVEPDYRGQGYGKELWARIRKTHPSTTFLVEPDPFKDQAKSKDELFKVYSSYGFKKHPKHHLMYLGPDKKPPTLKKTAYVNSTTFQLMRGVGLARKVQKATQPQKGH